MKRETRTERVRQLIRLSLVDLAKAQAERAQAECALKVQKWKLTAYTVLRQRKRERERERKVVVLSLTGSLALVSSSIITLHHA